MSEGTVCRTGLTHRVRRATGQSEGSLGNGTGYGGWDCAITSGAQGAFSGFPDTQAPVLAGKRVNGKGSCSGSYSGQDSGTASGRQLGPPRPLLAVTTPLSLPAPTRRSDRSPRPLSLPWQLCATVSLRKLPSRGNSQVNSGTKFLLFALMVPKILGVRCPFKNLIKTIGSLLGR